MLLSIFDNWTISLTMQALIAVGALIAAYYARQSFEKTKEIVKEQRLSRRGYLATSDVLGKLDDMNNLLVHLTNYGINTIKNIIVDLSIYTKASISNENKSLEPIFNSQPYSINPLSHNQPFDIIEPIHPVLNTSTTQYFIIARVKYFDIILKKYFDNEYFFWCFDKDNVLCEISPQEMENIKNILKINF